jgi:predicted nucleotidyltransferase
MKTLALRDKDIAALCAALQNFPSVLEVRVFGSRATGQARRASDLDLAISAPDATPLEWSDICEAIENVPIIYEIDLVRPEKTANERLREKIRREGIVIYPREMPSC